MQLDLNIPILEPAGSERLSEAALAAIEYTLAGSITIRDRSDIRSVKHWSERLEPFEHQVRNLITFCRRAPVALIADDVGMGKTISAGLIISELMVRKKVKRVLILAPKILLPQWCDELESKFGIDAVYATGAQLSRFARSRTSVVVTTYASALNRMEELTNSGFDMLVLDEAHKVRNLYGTARPPRIAIALKLALAGSAFRYTLLLTATPIHNRLWDIYSLIDLLADGRNHRNPLGDPEEFAARYLADGRNVARRINSGRVPEFRRIVGEYMVRTTRLESGLSFPERLVSPTRCEPGDIERRLEALVREHLPNLRRLQQISLAEALMSSPAAFADQIRTLGEAGRVSPSVVAEVRRLAESSPLGCKEPQLLAMARRLMSERPRDWRMVVFTRRIATQKAIGEALAAIGASVGYIGGGHGRTQDQDVRRYQADPPEVNVIVSTDSGAEGVNLQAGNVVVNYDLPWNPMTVEQRIGRVQRLASKHATVAVTNLVVKGSVEELVVARLMEKLQLISAAIGDIEGILEVAGKDDDLEEEIQDLVLRALAGQDVAESARRIEDSIERAKQLYEESKTLVSETLGTLNALHDAGPAAPELEDVVPRLSVRDLVVTYYSDRGRVQEQSDGRLLIQEVGRGTHFATFDENDPNLRAGPGVFGGRATRLYAEGEPDFERIVGSLSRKRLHSVESQPLDEEGVVRTAREWVASLDAQVEPEAVRVLGQRRRLEGTLTALVSSSVAVDRLERLIEVTSGPGGWVDEDASSRPAGVSRSRADGRLDRSHWPAPARDAVLAAIEGDRSLMAFRQFYLARKQEELEKAGGSAALREQIERRFDPSVSAELVAARGEMASIVSVEVTYRYRDGPESKLLLDIDGASHKVLRSPPLERCYLSGGSFPQHDLAPCAVSGERALPHLMAVSSVSGALMLPEFAQVCEISGDVMLPREAVRSAFSSRVISPRHAVTCEVSGLTAAEDEVGTCEFTGARAHKDHLKVSEASGKTFRGDQGQVSDLSGMSGHASEFVRCEFSGTVVLATEAERSAVSGEWVRSDWLVASEKNPSRRAARSETVRCAVSNALLLEDEVGRSVVSGLVVDRELLVPSALSGELALATELFTCEESGTRVLPDETASCSATGKRVRRDLLEESGISHKLYLRRLLRRCPETGVLGLENELETCQETGLAVAPEALATCTVTGRRVVKRLLVECAECSQPLLRSVATKTSRGELAHAQHVATSDFTGDLLLSSALGRCSASNLLIEQEDLVGEFAGPLVAVAEAFGGPESTDASMMAAATGVLSAIGVRPKRVWTRPTKRDDLVAVLAEVPRRLLTPPRRYAFFVDTGSGQLVGEIARVEPTPRGIRFSDAR
ncbi:MAG TPA: SNF2-related protein [Trueperaceae bacterium]